VETIRSATYQLQVGLVEKSQKLVLHIVWTHFHVLVVQKGFEDLCQLRATTGVRIMQEMVDHHRKQRLCMGTLGAQQRLRRRSNCSAA
jgi:hypothetical protein